MIADVGYTHIEAVTDQGTGLVLPLAKALSHIITVFNAVDRGWPLTVADAAAELEAAGGHMRDAVIPEDLMTPEAFEAIAGWRAVLTEETNRLTRNLNFEQPLAEAIDIPLLTNLAETSWQLLSHLDRELTGLEPNNADPGRLP